MEQRHRVDPVDVPGVAASRISFFRTRSRPSPVWHTSLHNPDWSRFAELCGATGIRVDRRDQSDPAMAALFAADGPALVHIEQDAELL
jgi:thiamine pyrophosphate-dependent acetolactate synthase large subunit-like protein